MKRLQAEPQQEKVISGISTDRIDFSELPSFKRRAFQHRNQHEREGGGKGGRGHFSMLYLISNDMFESGI